MTLAYNKSGDQTQETQYVQCCIAGCGPAGAMLGFLLARQGIKVLVLEKHKDFLRDFRGDTIHPSTLQIMDELGLVDQLLQLPHTKASHLQVRTSRELLVSADFSRLKTRWPYMVFLPQWDFLNFLVEQANHFPCFHLIMQAEAQEIIEDGEKVSGIRYRKDDSWHSVYAPLTVAADGRSSRMRAQARLTPQEMSPPMDVLWFQLSRDKDDPEETFFSISAGHIIGLINRGDYWQIAYAISKGAEQFLEEDLPQFKQTIGKLVPWLSKQLDEIQTPEQLKLLVVQANRLQRWYRPGLLCIGDAAHAMSPIGGVGINLAIQDAVVAANTLIEPLKEGSLRTDHLAAIQRERMWPTRLTQALQSMLQRRLATPALQFTNTVPRLPLPVRMILRLPGIRDLPARLICLGVRPVHVKNCSLASTSSSS